jgi:heptosyltransferase-2
MRPLLVVQTAFLGDVVLTTPLLRALRRAHPERALHVVATPLGAAVLAGHPAIDVLHPYAKRGRERGLRGLLRLARRLRSERFGIAVAAQRSARTGLLVRASGAELRVGFASSAGAWALTHRVPWLPARHAVHRYLALAAPAGADAQADPTPSLAVLPEAAAKVSAALHEDGVADQAALLALAPGSTWGTKRWTPEGFATVAVAAPERGLHPVLVGSPDERGLCQEVSALAGGGIANLAGRTGPPELTALLARARALVTNDSGPGHVASAVGTPVVTVFGPTVPAFGYTAWGARNRVVEHAGLACRPCSSHGPQVCPLGHHRCMREIVPADVLAALDAVLDG